MLTMFPVAASPSLTVSQVRPPSREWMMEAWLPPAQTSLPRAVTIENSKPAPGYASSHWDWPADLINLPPTTFHDVGIDSRLVNPGADNAPALNASDAAKLPASAFSGAALASAVWFFSSVALNDPGSPMVLEPSAPGRRVGDTFVRKCKLCTAEEASWPILYVKGCLGGAGVRMRTFELPAALVGMSENLVILESAVKRVPPTVCGCGADGKSFLLWPSSTTSALFVAKKSVLTKSFLCKPAVSAGSFAAGGGGGGAIDGAAPAAAAIFALAGSSRFACALASFAARVLAGAEVNGALEG